MKAYKLLVTSALAASMALSGAAFANEDGGKHKGWHGGGKRHVEQVLSQLPEDKAKLFKDSMKQSRQENKALREQRTKLRAELDAILTAEKFDKQAYLAKSAEISKTYGDAAARRAEAIAAVAEKLTPEERKILAKLRPAPRMRKGGVKDGMDRPGGEE